MPLQRGVMLSYNISNSVLRHRATSRDFATLSCHIIIGFIMSMWHVSIENAMLSHNYYVSVFFTKFNE